MKLVEDTTLFFSHEERDVVMVTGLSICYLLCHEILSTLLTSLQI